VIASEAGHAAALGRSASPTETQGRVAAGERSISVASFVVYAGAALWAVVFGALAWARYDAFLAGRFDLGNMVQAVWSTSEGHPFRTTSIDGSEISRLAAHVDPILAALAPLWLVWSSPVMLLTVQAIGLALGPPGLLARSQHLGSSGLGAALAFVYLLYTPVQWIDLYEFHAVTLAVPLLLFAIWFLDDNRLVPFAVMAGLAVADQGGDRVGGRRARSLVRGSPRATAGRGP
jgi:uncharacterized membrane protein